MKEDNNFIKLTFLFSKELIFLLKMMKHNNIIKSTNKNKNYYYIKNLK